MGGIFYPHSDNLENSVLAVAPLATGDPASPRPQGVCSALPWPPSPVGKKIPTFLGIHGVPTFPLPSKRGPRTCKSGLPPSGKDTCGRGGQAREARWRGRVLVPRQVIPIVSGAWPSTLIVLSSGSGRRGPFARSEACPAWSKMASQELLGSWKLLEGQGFSETFPHAKLNKATMGTDEMQILSLLSSASLCHTSAQLPA